MPGSPNGSLKATLQGWSLRARWAALVLATLIPVLCLGAYWIVSHSRSERAHAEEEVRETAAIVASETGRLVSGVQEMLAILARFPAIQAGNRPESERLFRDVLTTLTHLENLGLVTVDGLVAASAVPVPSGVSISLRDREWFQQVVRSGKPIVGGFQLSRIVDKPVAVLAHPVVDGAGRMTAVLTAALRLAAISQEIAPAQIKLPGPWAVVDRQGIVLLHSEPWGLIGKPLGEFPGMLRAEAIVPGAPWRAVVGLPESIVTDRARQEILMIGLPVGLVLLLAACAGFWITRTTLQPMQALAAAVRRVGIGEPSVSIPVEGAPEIAEVASALRDALAALERRHRELTALLEANQAVASSLELGAILQTIVREAAAIAGTQTVRLFLLDEELQLLRCQVGMGLPKGMDESLEIPVGKSFSGQVAATGRPLAVADCRGDSRLYYPEHVQRYGLVSYLGLPVIHGGRLFGVLVFNTNAPRTYTQEEIAFLSAFALQAAMAIQNAQVYHQEQARRQQLEVVRAVNAEIVRELELRDLLQLITRRSVALLGAASGTIYLWDEVEQALVPQAWSGLGEWMNEVRYRLGESLTGSVAERQQGMIVNDYRSWQGADHLFLQGSRITAAVSEPLLYRERLVGVITINNEDTGRAFTKQDRELLALFASQAAIAIENARLFAATERAAREARSLYEIAHSLTTSLDVSEVLRLIALKTTELLGTPHAQVVLWDEATQALRLGAAYGTEAERVQGQQFRLGAGVNGIVAETRAPLIVNDYQTFPQRVTDLTELVAVIGVPLLCRDRLLGVLTSHATASGAAFTQAHLALLTSFAAQAAIAIENARLHRSSVHRGEQLEALLRATRSVMSGLNLQTILDRIVAEAAQIAGTPHVEVMLVDPPAQVLRVAAFAGSGLPLGFQVPMGNSYSGHVAVTARPLFVADVQQGPMNPLFERDREVDFRAYLGLPIKIRDEVFGVLSFNTTTPRRYSPEELAYLTSFADQAAIAIENARLFAELNQSYQALQRAQEELIRSEKLRALGQMAAGIAHDLNNLLAAILGQAELLRLQGPTSDVRQAVDLLVTAASDGAEIVRRLQAFARQQPTGPLGVCELPALVAEVVALTRPRWKDEPQRRGVVIQVRTVLADCPPILGYAPEIREALTNLILNAVDAMPQGGTLRLDGRLVPATDDREQETGENASDAGLPSSVPGQWAELTVTDTGVGMAEDIRQRIFDPFFSTKGGRGTGLGLSVVYGIMERHGGQVSVASTLGAGTRVVLRFRAAPRGASAPPLAPPLPVAARRILFIDDDPGVRLTLASLLRSAGHTVTEAEGGAEGLARFAEAAVDCVLTDLGMPEMTGWDVAKAVKAQRPLLPVILLTGWGDQPAVEAGAGIVVDRLLTKPVRFESLLAVIADLTATPFPASLGGKPTDG